MTCTRRKFLLGMGTGSVVFLSWAGTGAFADGKVPVRFAMIHDEERCNGCDICAHACRSVNTVPETAARLTIAHVRAASSDDSTDYQYFRMSCQHCEAAPCIEVCPTGASWRDESNGIVRVNKQQCIGCSYCISACPYQVRYLNKKTSVADKCDFCLETRLSKGFPPICVTSCPQKALIFGREDSEPVQTWLKNNAYYQYQLPGVGKPHLYRRFAQHKVSKMTNDGGVL
ncbi:4Fe-4S dicluster domain-containing protein [Telmatospirillum sp.]|uniref:4Fe-4S dicluster domain-containing protein n=1 Tax=Telmatospirillum sp. TaxID=2079197 RepID=UPI00283B6D29|nr:4Fe-4S dicluster domain-containing protein [Telmatospirillum sp.]MDR3439107.1 4Fe-4S dicluster domain-containing protein [Telmatospirillum sp.]